ncbi:MAG TPA: crossover junction endodeoxyribonuclease RuvC [Polyangiaceae bacterium]|nr:crossover junction endodeoxyribonuclease RuvC [Polyangiaceae bacterium]
MIALGIDPGTRHLGWGVVEAEGNRIRHVAHGVIDASPTLTLEKRLAVIDRELAVVIDRYRPLAGSVETLFFHKDAQAAAKLGHARGVVLLGLCRANVPVAEYAPAHVKRVITGKGNADKRQVAHMIRALLALEEAPKSDAADALALAVTHCRRSPIDAALCEQRAGSAPDPAILALFRPKRRGRASARLRFSVR